jgi:hypothetical protein
MTELLDQSESSIGPNTEAGNTPSKENHAAIRIHSGHLKDRPLAGKNIDQ